jgi:hypothetical protein
MIQNSNDANTHFRGLRSGEGEGLEDRSLKMSGRRQEKEMVDICMTAVRANLIYENVYLLGRTAFECCEGIY